jgi:hypothetical protein
MENVVYRQMSHKSASTFKTACLDKWFGFPERGCRSLLSVRILFFASLAQEHLVCALSLWRAQA